MPPAQPRPPLSGEVGLPGQPVSAGSPPAKTAAPAAGPPAVAQDGPVPDDWGWPDAASVSGNAPLQALILTGTKLMGIYGQDSVRAAGLKVSLAGLEVLRVLMAEDGLKASEVADRAFSSPGTMTAVTNTLVRDGFVERRADEADRRVVRLSITEPGRSLITYYVSRAVTWWGKAFDFVDPEDEAVVRRFFVQLIDHFGKLIREERGA